MSVVFLSSFEDATPGSDNTWTDYDSANVPDGAIGVILRLRFQSGTGSAGAFGARKNGSTDDRHETIDAETASFDAGAMFFIGVDANGIFEVKVLENAQMVVELIGYFTSGAGAFFTNLTEKSPTVDDTWTDFDISSDTGGDTAVAAIVEISNTFRRDGDFRINGSTDDHTDDTQRKCGVIVGCDANEIYEARAEDVQTTQTSFYYLAGYLTGGITWRTNASSVTPVAAWTDRTFDAGAIAGILKGPLNASRAVGLRKNGSAEDILYIAKDMAWLVSECDGSGIAEHNVDSTTGAVLYDAGYFTALGGGATTRTLTSTASGLVRDLGKTNTATLSGLIQLQAQTRTAVFNAQVRDTFTATATTNAKIFQAGKTLTAALSGLVKVFGISLTAVLNAEVKSVASLVATLNAKIHNTLSLTAVLSAKIRDTLSATAVLNAKIRDIATQTATLNGVVRAENLTNTATLNAKIFGTRTATATLNAVVGAIADVPGGGGPYITILRRRRR